MGQRLNIEIVGGCESLANSYYHWSAYTSGAKYLTRMIVLYLQKSRTTNPIKKAIRCLEKTGAGLTAFELKEAKKLYPKTKFKKAIDRNDGLIAITKENMKETRDWEEGRVTIDIYSQKIYFDVFWIDNVEDYKEERELNNISNIKVLKNDPCIITFEDFLKNYEGYAIDCVIYDNKVYQPIE